MKQFKCTRPGIAMFSLGLLLATAVPTYAADSGMESMDMGGANSGGGDHGKMKGMDPYTPIEVGRTEQLWGDHIFKIMVEGGEWKVGKNLKVMLMVTQRYKEKDRPVKGAEITADLLMPEMGHNLEHGLRFTESSGGHYTASIRLEMPGTYGLLFNFQKGDKMHTVNFNFVATK